jgi:Protein of unknown function (DUF2384)
MVQTMVPHTEDCRTRKQEDMSPVTQKTSDLSELLAKMNDYAIASEKKEWLSSPLEALGGRTPQQLIDEGRIRDLVLEFDRLRDGQPV